MENLPPALHFINKNQIWAIAGDNESGHSTLLNGIAGKNTAHVSFRHPFKTRSNTKDFYYQQRFNSFDSEDALTVKEYLVTEEAISATWTIEKVITEFNLRHLLDEQVIKLSNGETKRLLIAAALIKNPQLLLLDHPLTGLDVATRTIFSNLLNKINNSGVTVIMATDPREIPSAVTHVAVMEKETIIFHGEKSVFRIDDFNFTHPFPLNHEILRSIVAPETGQTFRNVVSMKNVVVEYDGRKILDGISWTVKQGDRWSLSGPNGAGKSTLLSLINGDNPQAYANDIVLFDRQRGSGESIWDIKKHTGFVSPELFQYFPTDSTCLHVIESGFYDTVGLFRPTNPEKEMICTRWMELLQISKYALRLFSMVPSDVQRLCLLARALVKNPALLILDEPTQGLDISQQQFFTNLIDSICRISNVTVIYVSHYEHHIPPVVDKHLRLENGKMA